MNPRILSFLKHQKTLPFLTRQAKKNYLFFFLPRGNSSYGTTYPSVESYSWLPADETDLAYSWDWRARIHLLQSYPLRWGKGEVIYSYSAPTYTLLACRTAGCSLSTWPWNRCTFDSRVDFPRTESDPYSSPAWTPSFESSVGSTPIQIFRVV
jgi:hypothetical protein